MNGFQVGRKRLKVQHKKEKVPNAFGEVHSHAETAAPEASGAASPAVN
jgi:hypothetical protein